MSLVPGEVAELRFGLRPTSVHELHELLLLRLLRGQRLHGVSSDAAAFGAAGVYACVVSGALNGPRNDRSDGGYSADGRLSAVARLGSGLDRRIAECAAHGRRTRRWQPSQQPSHRPCPPLSEALDHER
jgi:hypothetical protein